MSVAELKEKARQSLDNINDEAVLEEVVMFLESEEEYIRTGFIHLTEQQKAGVKKGIDDIQAGRVVSHEDILTETNRLFGNDD